MLVDDLRSLGQEVWLDREVVGGRKWWEHVLEKIRQADVFVYALSPSSLDSTACAREFAYGTALHRPVLPVVVEPDISVDLLPRALGEIQLVDYSMGDKTAAIALARAILHLPKAPSLPDPLPASPPPPMSYLGELREQVLLEGMMPLDSQAALLFKLKSALADERRNREVLELLRRFSEREDLYAKIDRELRAILFPLTRPDSSASDSMESTSQREGGSEPTPSPAQLPADRKTQDFGSKERVPVPSTEPRMGRCPNPPCRIAIPLNSRACTRCGALFGPSSSWKVEE